MEHVLKSPLTHEPRNPEKLQNPMPVLKSVGKEYFPVRHWVSSPGYTRVRNKLDLRWSGCFRGFLDRKPNVKQKFQRMLRDPCADLIPHKPRFEHRNNSYKEQKKCHDQSFSSLYAANLEAGNVPFHETANELDRYVRNAPKNSPQTPIQTSNSVFERSFWTLNYTKEQIPSLFAKDSLGVWFVLVLHGTDCRTDHDMANVQESAAHGKFSSLPKSKSKCSNWAHWVELKWLSLSVSERHYNRRVNISQKASPHPVNKVATKRSSFFPSSFFPSSFCRQKSIKTMFNRRW